jgi:protein SCO1/2
MLFSKGHLLQGACLALLAICFNGCRSQSEPQSFTPPTPHPATYEHHPLHGTVLGLSPQTSQITVRHDAIPGFMPAMTMSYMVKDSSVLARLQTGDEINATMLVPDNAESYQLDQIQVIGHATGQALATLPAHALLTGESIPDVELENQDGKRIHLRSYSGKALLVTFIYTRCPMPTACPMITSHFARVHALLATNPAVYAASHQLSITLDPAYDTPKVLRNYGLAYLGDQPAGFAHWELARTAPNDLKSLAASFGLEYHQQDNQILHTVRTVLIGRNGKLVRTWDGSSWKPQEIADAVALSASGSTK